MDLNCWYLWEIPTGYFPYKVVGILPSPFGSCVLRLEQLLEESSVLLVNSGNVDFLGVVPAESDRFMMETDGSTTKGTSFRQLLTTAKIIQRHLS